MSKEITKETRNNHDGSLMAEANRDIILPTAIKDAPIKYVCEECGGSNVQYCKRVWYDANTDELESDEDDWEDTYCDDCCENHSLTDPDEYSERDDDDYNDDEKDGENTEAENDKNFF